jgi:hypothetical protein
MKICPECQERYHDDVASCPKDGEDLVDVPEELSGNPRILEPVASSPADRTSMIDLEAIEAKRKVKRTASEGEGVGDDKTPPPSQPNEADRDATGTLQRTRNQAADRHDSIPEDRRVNEEPTNKDLSSRSRTGRSRITSMTSAGRDVVVVPASGTRTGMKTAPRPRRAMSGTQAAVLVMFGVLALVGAIMFFARATAVLTVTTVPPGASVALDGEAVGLSPLQKRVRTSSHTVELSLDGYEPFKEVVDVPSGGLPFLQPLQKKPPPPPPPPTSAQIASELVAAARAAFEAKDLEGARRKVAQALRLEPELPEATSIMKDIGEATAVRAESARKAALSAANGARLQQARVLAEEGRRLYGKGSLGPAKEKLYASLKLDDDNPEPHRTLGRIFNREDQVDKVRYHLQRYLELGGADGDFKVREWLKTHAR